MEVPRYRLDRQQPNNVASIWLLRGTAKHVLFARCGSGNTQRFVPRPRAFSQQSFGFVARLRSKVQRLETTLLES
jgi:hypothetical protein